MNELHEELERLAADRVYVTIVKLEYESSKWSVGFQRKEDGVKIEVNVTSETLANALNDAIMKWKRTTGGIKEFSGQLLEHVRPTPTPVDLNDEIPF